MRGVTSLARPESVDVLTGLTDRNGLSVRLAEAIDHHARIGERLALLVVDIDGFTTVNDSLGTRAGDALLRAASSRFARVIRPSDTLARVGSDEFAVVAGRLDPDAEVAESQARRIARRLMAVASEPFSVCDRSVAVSGKVGVGMAEPGRTDAHELQRQANVALHHRADPSGLTVFDERIDAEIQRTAMLDHEIRRALAQGELTVHLQPRIDLINGELDGAEALLRWEQHRPDPLDTASVIAVAERNGLIVEIGRRVLIEAVTAAAELRRRGILKGSMRVSVNVSSQQLVRDDFVPELAELLQQHGLPADAVILELTESALLDDLMAARRRIGELRSLGIPTAIDDFGTGYSSLAYLRDLPVDELKLDRMFIADLGRDRNAEAIVEGVVAMAESLGVTVVAEGVERVDQRDFLASVGCGSYQGYLTSPALPIEEFAEMFSA